MHSSTKKIKKIHSVFSASAPLETPDNFIGRTKEKQSIIRSLYAQGRHVVVHGERGVGKSSLLNVVTKEFADSEKYIRVRHICTSEDTFDEILFTYLHETGQSYESSPARERTTRHLDSRLKVVAAEGGVKSSKEKEISHTPVLDSSVSPHSLASRYCKRPALFVIDEFDRVVSDHTKNQLSQFIKVLADNSSPVKLIIGGVSESGLDLVGGHPSTARCLAMFNLPRMSHREITTIIEKGSRRLGFVFEQALIDLIVIASNGLPYFPHLLSEQLAIKAIDNGIKIVPLEYFFDVLQAACDLAPPEPRSSFDLISSPIPPGMLGDFGSTIITTPGAIRRLAVLSLALTYADDLMEAISVINFLSTQKGVFIPTDYQDMSEEELEVILSEVSQLSDIILEHQGKVQFKDAMHRGYAWLQAAKEFGKNEMISILQSVLPKKM